MLSLDRRSDRLGSGLRTRCGTQMWTNWGERTTAWPRTGGAGVLSFYWKGLGTESGRRDTWIAARIEMQRRALIQGS